VCVHDVSLLDANSEASFLLADLTTGVFLFLMVDCSLWVPHSTCSLISRVLWVFFEPASCFTCFPLLLFFLAVVCMFEAEVCCSWCSLFTTVVWRFLLFAAAIWKLLLLFLFIASYCACFLLRLFIAMIPCCYNCLLMLVAFDGKCYHSM
jgi:hypothetical protein